MLWCPEAGHHNIQDGIADGLYQLRYYLLHMIPKLLKMTCLNLITKARQHIITLFLVPRLLPKL